MEITEFLMARIAEDEEIARRNSGDRGLGDDGSFPDYRTYSDSDTDAADDFIAHFAPRRVLVECEAKRRIVALVRGPLEAVAWTAIGCSETTDPGDTQVGDKMLCALALPYADHTDYDPDWAR